MVHPSRRASAAPLALVLLAALFASCHSLGPRQDEVGVDFDEFEEFDEFSEFDDDEPEPEREEVWDPLMGYNRVMFAFNDKVFLYVWNPVAKGWRFVAPEPARVCIDNAFTNLYTPIRFVNSLLQFEFGKAGTELGRFVVNSTVGIGGLFDPADAWLDWRAPSPEDFGQTLAVWGVGEGFPFVIPFLGPSNVRDGLALVPDGFLNPLYYVTDGYGGVAFWVGDNLNATSLRIGQYESLKRDALDPYTLFRDAYHQNRLKKIEE